MQIIVLGMHRSGTSLATRLIHMMGAYLGPDALFGANRDNPTGYWERSDVVRCNAALLRHLEPNWRHLIVTPWIGEFTPPPLSQVQERMQGVIAEMDAHTPWVMKDPHLCLTLPYWLPFLTRPACVVVYRDPREIAQSLAIRKHNAVPSLERGLALWEHYAVSALNATFNLPCAYVNHAEMLAEPLRAADALFHELQAQGTGGLRQPSHREIAAYFDPKLYRAKAEASPALTPFQEKLCAMLRGDIPAEPGLAVSQQTQNIVSAEVESANTRRIKIKQGSAMTAQDELRMMQRIAVAIERLAPQPEPPADIKSADAFVWDAERKMLQPVADTQPLALSLLKGIDAERDALLANTAQFAKGFSANNALLWGARGMGKSSLIKSVWAEVNKGVADPLKRLALVEIHREDLASLPHLVHTLRGWVIRRFVVFCDDLSFDSHDASYKSLKSVLEGGIEARPDHILFYATSNRRHLMPREMIDNEKSTALQPGEAVEEKVSLSDRFGLWIGFHTCSLDTYLAIVDAYAQRYKLDLPAPDLHQQAFQWAAARGARSGRVAWQFIQDLAGKMGKRIS